MEYAGSTHASGACRPSSILGTPTLFVIIYVVSMSEFLSGLKEAICYLSIKKRWSSAYVDSCKLVERGGGIEFIKRMK